MSLQRGYLLLALAWRGTIYQSLMSKCSGQNASLTIIWQCLYVQVLFIYSFVCCDSLNNLPFIWTARVLCKCDECRGLVKPVKPSEWERHTGCRKKKWKESIRVKNLDQPLVQWVSSFWMNCIILENLVNNILSMCLAHTHTLICMAKYISVTLNRPRCKTLLQEFS